MVVTSSLMQYDGRTWHVMANVDMDATHILRGEIHNINNVLSHDMPIMINGMEFRPLCKEFPGGSGIDLIMVGPDGHLLLVECKNSGRSCWAMLQTQALHRAKQYGKKTLHEICEYLENPERASDRRAESRKRLLSWSRENGYSLLRTKFDDLLHARRLLFMSMLEGTWPALLLEHPECGLVGCHIQFDRTGRKVRLEIAHDLDSYYAMSDADLSARLKHQYNLYELKKGGKSVVRRSIPRDQVEAYFQSLGDQIPTGLMYLHLRDRFQEVAGGSGRSANKTITLRLRRGRAKAPFVLLRGEGCVEIHIVSLAGHIHEFGVGLDLVVTFSPETGQGEL